MEIVVKICRFDFADRNGDDTYEYIGISSEGEMYVVHKESFENRRQVLFTNCN